MSYKREVLSDGTPLFFFRMAERGNVNPVDSGGAVTSNLPGTGFPWGVRGAIEDPNNWAGNFNGTDRFFNMTSRTAMTSNQTRIAWVRTTSTAASSSYAGDPALTILGDTTGAVWDGFGVHAGKAQFNRFNNSTWQTFASAKSVNDGRWHMIAATYNSTTRAVVIYVDGVADGSGTVTAHQVQGGVNVLARGQVNDWYGGDLDEVEAWSSVLPANRILARYQVGRRQLAARRPL